MKQLYDRKQAALRAHARVTAAKDEKQRHRAAGRGQPGERGMSEKIAIPNLLMKTYPSDDAVDEVLSCTQNIIDDAVATVIQNGHKNGIEVRLLGSTLEVALLRAAAGVAVVTGRCSPDEDNLDAFVKLARMAYMEASGTKTKRRSAA